VSVSRPRWRLGASLRRLRIWAVFHELLSSQSLPVCWRYRRWDRVGSLTINPSVTTAECAVISVAD